MFSHHSGLPHNGLYTVWEVGTGRTPNIGASGLLEAFVRRLDPPQAGSLGTDTSGPYGETGCENNRS